MRQRRFDDHPIERLVKHGFVTLEQREACNELHAIHCAIFNAANIKNHQTERSTDNSHRGLARLGTARYRRVYDSFMLDLGGDGPMIAEMVEGSATFTSLAHKYGMRWCNARAKLVDALARWVSMRATERA